MNYTTTTSLLAALMLLAVLAASPTASADDECTIAGSIGPNSLQPTYDVGYNKTSDEVEYNVTWHGVMPDRTDLDCL